MREVRYAEPWHKRLFGLDSGAEVFARLEAGGPAPARVPVAPARPDLAGYHAARLCPWRFRLDGCGCNGLVGCGLGKGSGRVPIRECRECPEARAALAVRSGRALPAPAQ